MFLCEAVRLSVAESEEIYATDESGVLCSSAKAHLACLAPCSQGGKHVSKLLHVADAVQKGYKKMTIHTVDTDVKVVVAVVSFSKIAPDELWLAFGVTPSFRYIANSQNRCLNESNIVFDSLSLSHFHRV